MKKAQVTKADVQRFKEWLETQMVCERTSVDTRHYPAFQEILEEYDDKPPVWQIKKPLSYKCARNYKTGGTFELGQGESYVDICGENTSKTTKKYSMVTTQGVKTPSYSSKKPPSSPTSPSATTTYHLSTPSWRNTHTFLSSLGTEKNGK